MNEYRFKTKYLGSEMGINEYRVLTKSLGEDLY